MAVLPDGHNVSFEHVRKRLDLTMHTFLNAMPLGGASLVRIAQFGRVMTGTALGRRNSTWRPGSTGVLYLKAMDTFMLL